MKRLKMKPQEIQRKKKNVRKSELEKMRLEAEKAGTKDQEMQD